MLIIILFGLFGSILGDLLFLTKLRQIPKDERPNFRKISFYIPIVVNAIIGFGFVMAYYYTIEELTPILAIHIGASSPLIARIMLTTKPPI